ncbi:MAG: transcriptional repressor LexA [Bdellovibrionia bacterium]
MKTPVSRAKKGTKDKSESGVTPSPVSLTPKQKAMLDYLLQYQEEKGYNPSQQEIAKHFGFSSLGTVQNYLVRLERQGAIQKDWNARRGTVVLNNNGPQVPTDRQAESGGGFTLPLLGRVAAGLPIEAIENREMVEIPRTMVGRRGEHFVLLVQGDSMIDEGILDGDQVIIKKQATAENGQTVVALVGNEATIKKYYLKKGRVELHPANAKYSPIIVDPEVTESFRIEGIMVGLIRRC